MTFVDFLCLSYCMWQTIKIVARKLTGKTDRFEITIKF
jgi:hypothetical protein